MAPLHLQAGLLLLLAPPLLLPTVQGRRRGFTKPSWEWTSPSLTSPPDSWVEWSTWSLVAAGVGLLLAQLKKAAILTKQDWGAQCPRIEGIRTISLSTNVWSSDCSLSFIFCLMIILLKGWGQHDTPWKNQSSSG